MKIMEIYNNDIEKLKDYSFYQVYYFTEIEFFNQFNFEDYPHNNIKFDNYVEGVHLWKEKILMLVTKDGKKEVYEENKDFFIMFFKI